MLIPIFFSPKKKLYYFKGEEICNSCKNNIENDLICNIQWSRKKEPILKYYCLNCHLKIKDYGGEIIENFICVVSKSIPESAYPIFFFPPSLINYRGESVFSAVFIKNSEAEIIDHTRLAGRPDHNRDRVALEIKRNKELLEKRDKELGLSPFALADQRRETENKVREETKELRKLDSRSLEYRQKKEEIKNTAEQFNEELNKDLDIDGFLSGVKNSKPLIEQEERKLLEL